MSLRVNFCNSITFVVTNEYGKDSGIEIEAVFWPVYYVAYQEVLSNGSF